MKAIIVLLCTAMGLQGCSAVDRLFFVEESHIGLKAKMSPNSTAPVDIDFGYRRSVLALVPKANAGADQDSSAGKTPSSDQADPNEPLSVISSFSADVGWFAGAEVHAYFATGKAAVNAARSNESIRALVAGPQPTEKGN